MDENPRFGPKNVDGLFFLVATLSPVANPMKSRVRANQYTRLFTCFVHIQVNMLWKLDLCLVVCTSLGVLYRSFPALVDWCVSLLLWSPDERNRINKDDLHWGGPGFNTKRRKKVHGCLSHLSAFLPPQTKSHNFTVQWTNTNLDRANL